MAVFNPSSPVAVSLPDQDWRKSQSKLWHMNCVAFQVEINTDSKTLSSGKAIPAISMALFHTLHNNPWCLCCLYVYHRKRNFGPERDLMGCSEPLVKWCGDFILAHVAAEKPRTSQGPKMCKVMRAMCVHSGTQWHAGMQSSSRKS